MQDSYLAVHNLQQHQCTIVDILYLGRILKYIPECTHDCDDQPLTSLSDSSVQIVTVLSNDPLARRDPSELQETE